MRMGRPSPRVARYMRHDRPLHRANFLHAYRSSTMTATRPPWPFPASTCVPSGEPTPPVDATTTSSRPQETLPPTTPRRGAKEREAAQAADKRRARDGAPDGLVWDGKAEPPANRGGGDTSSPSGREYAGGHKRARTRNRWTRSPVYRKSRRLGLPLQASGQPADAAAPCKAHPVHRTKVRRLRQMRCTRAMRVAPHGLVRSAPARRFAGALARCGAGH
jgi:hypothetical protein